MSKPSMCEWKKELGIMKTVLLMLSHYFTFFLLLGLVLFWIFTPFSIAQKILISAAVLYFLPPLLALLIRWIFPIKNRKIPFGSREFMTWWSIFSLQVVYLRFPFLEEILRSIPGVYSFWIRLWGSKVGRTTYWAAGVSIQDRSFICIGDNVMMGAGVRLTPHVNIKNEEGNSILLLDKITIGNRCVVGGYSLLTAGTVICDDENTRACLISPPFSVWKNNRRVKNQHDR